ncbi:MAG: phosphoribosylaminoimidazolesuccinocarboxamide synthase [Planctomycetota bacterium]
MSAAQSPLFRSDLPLPDRREGKVRDVYRLPSAGEQRLLIVASDRISAFDVIMPTPIPGKGRILTSMAEAWFDFIARLGLAPTHLRSTEVADVPGLTDEQQAMLDGRVMIGCACEVVPVECVVRGYLEGSGWKEYRRTGAVCGVQLPTGLERGAQLPEPIFTPATKAEQGAHDENISFDDAANIAGVKTMTLLRDTSLAIYEAAHAYAEDHGVILADTKFEFGYPIDDTGARSSEDPILIDEALTPDSSRYWPADRWAPGKEQESFDKQFLREYLQRLTDADAWDKRAPGPQLPEDIVEGTLARYREAQQRLFG